MAFDDTTLPPDDDAPLTGSESLPQQGSTRRKYDPNATVDKLYRNHAAALREGTLQDEVASRMYNLYRPRILRIVKRYCLLSPIFDEEDLRQEAMEAIDQSLRTYKHDPDIKMKFSTRLEWSISNIFQRRIGKKDRFVEIYGPDGSFVKTMSYHRFVDRKKDLEAAGYTATTKRRVCSLSDALLDKDLKAMLVENPAVDNDYGEPAHTEELEEKQETQEEKGGDSEEMSDDEEQTEVAAAPSAVPPPTNEVDLRMIDGLYRRWALTKGKEPVTQDDPFVLRVYGLYREQGEALLLPFRNNGTALSGDEARQAILSAIVQGVGCQECSALAAIPFSVALRVAMKRSADRLRKKRTTQEKGGEDG